MDRDKKISVCIPTYNGGKYLNEQLKSILAQLGTDDEIVISDDGSSDDTLEIIATINDTRIKVFHHKKIFTHYTGVKKTIFAISKNVENALSKAKGEYIFLADQDDIWVENKVEIILNDLITSDLVIHNCSLIDNSGNVFIADYFRQVISPSARIWRTIYKSSFHGCCIAFNHKLLTGKILPFTNLAIGHDTWIGIAAIKSKSNIRFNPAILISYRRHDSNVSFCSNQSQNSLWFKVSYRLNLLWAYITV